MRVVGGAADVLWEHSLLIDLWVMTHTDVPNLILMKLGVPIKAMHIPILLRMWVVTGCHITPCEVSCTPGG